MGIQTNPWQPKTKLSKPNNALSCYFFVLKASLMENEQLEKILRDVAASGSGVVLRADDKPAAVVLSVEKYNELINAARMASTQVRPGAVLVTGGAGYIGSHVVRALVKEGYETWVIDNLSYGERENVDKGAHFLEGDLSDENFLRDVFGSRPFSAVVHLAASVEVGESWEKAEYYLQNNAVNTERLLKVMAEHGVKRLVFSSTAAVYGNQKSMPISEKAAVQPESPYAHSKFLAEEIVRYYCLYKGMEAVIFRYFNAAGSDFDGRLISKHDSHLITAVMNVAGGQSKHLVVHGNDYETFDGTGVRDYVHVLDIARAHVAALASQKISGAEVINIGTGHGHSVEQVVRAAAECLNRIIPMEIGPRRAGDPAAAVADNARLKEVLGLELVHSDLENILRTSWVAFCANKDNSKNSW